MEKPKPDSAKSAPELTENQVADYLRRHPDFIAKHPDLLGQLTPPERRQGDNVVDMQSYMIEHLRSELGGVRQDQAALIETSRGNMSIQARVHEAVIALLNAASFEQFVETLTTDLALKLGVDIVSLCVEQETPPVGRTRTGVRFLTPGSVGNLFGAEEEILLRANSRGEAAIYGRAGRHLVRSDALLRLEISDTAPVGLLALGSRDEGHFSPHQGTELLTFLGKAIESTARAWLDLPA